MKKLTSREEQIANLLVKGMSNKEIADELFISVHTVKANLENIYFKFEIHNRVQLAIYLVKNNYVEIPS